MNDEKVNEMKKPYAGQAAGKELGVPGMSATLASNIECTSGNINECHNMMNEIMSSMNQIACLEDNIQTEEYKVNSLKDLVLKNKDNSQILHQRLDLLHSFIKEQIV